jgi:hypothetical protein
MDHQIEQLLDFSLKAQEFFWGCCLHGSSLLKTKKTLGLWGRTGGFQAKEVLNESSLSALLAKSG